MPTSRGYPTYTTGAQPNGPAQGTALAQKINDDVQGVADAVNARPRGELVQQTRTTNSSGSTGTPVTALGVTATLTAGRTYYVEAVAAIRQEGGTGVRGSLPIYDTGGGLARQGAVVSMDVSATAYDMFNRFRFTPTSTGSYTFTARVQRVAGSGASVFVNAGTDQPGLMSIIEVTGG